MDYSQFIINQLDRIGYPHKPITASGWVRIKCVRPEGHKNGDRTNKLGIYCRGENNLPAKCLGCSLVTSWNGSKNKPGIADLIGAERIGKQPEIGDPEFNAELAIDNLNKEIATIKPSINPLAKVLLPEEAIKEWKGDYVRDDTIMVGESTLKKIPTYKWRDVSKYGHITKRIMWPISIDGELFAYTGRAITESKLRWNTQPPGSSVLRRVMFPYDLYGQLDTVVLVEGPTSALRFIDHGIPALAILGASNWSKDKRNLLVKKGVSNVLLCFDGDPAGEQATAVISRELDKYFNVGRIQLPKDADPGNCSIKVIKKIKHIIKHGF